MTLLTCAACHQTFKRYTSKNIKLPRFCSSKCYGTILVKPRDYMSQDDFRTFFVRNISIRSEVECWPWIGMVGGNGYGIFTKFKKLLYAHRASYEFYNGIPPGKNLVLHKCDNPICVNPSHLYLGTHKENTRDMVVRGRVNSKLSPQDIRTIRDIVSTGGTLSDVHLKFPHITKDHLRNVISGKIWGHIT